MERSRSLALLEGRCQAAWLQTSARVATEAAPLESDAKGGEAGVQGQQMRMGLDTRRRPGSRHGEKVVRAGTTSS